MPRITAMRRAIVVIALLTSTAAFAQDHPDLVITATEEALVLPGLPITIEVRYFNRSRTVPATATWITLTSIQPFVSAPPGCTIAGNHLTCSVGTVAPQTGEEPDVQVLTAAVRTPDQSGRRFQVIAQISSREADAAPLDNVFTLEVLSRTAILVTTTADSGPGSLREAIHTANALCTSGDVCTIAFRIASTPAPWVTIAAATPLPPVTGFNVDIDGETQALFFGDTNPLGPEVELTGAAQREGHGLVSAGCGGFTVSGLAINGFPGSGVLLASAPCEFFSTATPAVRKNYIGTDPTGTRSVPNQRGVSVDGVVDAEVVDNVISGNLRSGVYLQRGRARVQRNLIGLTPARTPLGNGASGVYMGGLAAGSDVSGNTIAFNSHWGIAMHRELWNGRAAPNSVYGNFGLGIDWGSDMNPQNGPLPPPVITDALIIDNGQTLVRGTMLDIGSGLLREIHVYANDAPHWTGYGEGQQLLGTAHLGEGTFQFFHHEGLRGKWITATFTHLVPAGNGSDVFITTSEFSRAVQVK